MIPSKETDQSLEYTFDGFTYKVMKTNPPSFIISFDFSHPRYSDKPQTWAEIKLLFDVLP